LLTIACNGSIHWNWSLCLFCCNSTVIASYGT